MESKVKIKKESKTSDQDFHAGIVSSISLARDNIQKLSSILERKPSSEALQKSITRYKNDAVDQILRNTPISVLNRDRIGIRISALENAGYHNVYQIQGVSYQKLLGIAGIGQGNANLILSTIEKICSEVKNRVSINPEQCFSGEMDAILKECYIFGRLTDLYGQCQKTFAELYSAIQREYKSIEKYESSTKWFWTISVKKRAVVFDTAEKIKTLLSPKIVESIEQAYRCQDRIKAVSITDVKNDYLTYKRAYQESIISLQPIQRRDDSIAFLDNVDIQTTVDQANVLQQEKVPAAKGAILVLALCACVGCLIVGLFKYSYAQKSNKYEYALQCIDNCEYNEAKSVFEGIKGFKDADQLSVYCYYANSYIDHDGYVEGSTELGDICLKYSKAYQEQIDNLAQYATDLENTEQIALEEALKEYWEKEEQEIRDKYANILPQLGMSEKYINFTKLGEADSVEKCRDFDHLVPRGRTKTYTWGNFYDKYHFFSVTIKYRRHWSNRLDDYTDYPDGEGFVFSITYYDSNGMIHNVDMNDD